MNLDDTFPSKYLKAEDLQGRDIRVKMKTVNVEELGQDRKPVVYFEGKEKGVVLNKTNYLAIRDKYGPETNNWLGKEIILFPMPVTFQGQTRDAIRIRVPAPESELGNDDIPW